MSENSKKPIFIIGMGRSGTNLLAKSLTYSLDAKNMYEQRYLWSGINAYSEKVNSYSSSRSKAIHKHINKYAHEYKYFIDKTPGNLFRTQEILDIFPNAKFIFVVRHPFDNMFSREKLLAPEQNRLSRLFGHFLNMIKRGSLPLARLPFFLLDQLLLIFLRLYTKTPLLGKMERVSGIIESYAEGGEWRVYENQLMASLSLHTSLENKDYFLTIRYEDITLDHKLAVNKISEHLDLNDLESSNLLNYLEKNVRPITIGRWKDNSRLSRTDLQNSYYRLEEYFKKFGYKFN